MRHPVSYQIFPIATNCSMHICSKNSGLPSTGFSRVFRILCHGKILQRNHVIQSPVKING